MKRDIQALKSQEYDLLIIGGGIYGAACAWDATLRGLKVALLERHDFGWSTSSNSAKIAHSGLRYLQHVDYKRMRESIRERNLIHQRAPHLINSQPYLLPVYGHGIKGKETMSIYIRAYDLCSLDRQWFDDPARKIPGSYMISKEEVLKIVPDIDTKNLTGGAVWYEGQMHNTERLLLSYMRSAEERGANILNYVEAVDFFTSGQQVTGVQARDCMTGDLFTVKAKSVINASGPWIMQTLNLTEKSFSQKVHASKAFSLLTRPLTDKYALTFPIREMYEDRQAVIDKKSSLSFAIPWRGLSLIGSLHLPCGDDPEKVTITEEEIQTYIDLINEGYPAAKLRREDVRHVLWGIVPADAANSAAPLKHYQLLDHSKDSDLTNLVSVVGVKYTTARDVAEKAIDLIFTKLDKSKAPCKTHEVPLWGGDIEYLNEFKQKAIEAESQRFDMDVMHHLIHTYGTNYPSVLALIEEDSSWAQTIPGSNILKAEIIYAVREEMAQKLVDVIMRRTDLGSLEYPDADALKTCAALMASELGWDESRIQDEIADLEKIYIVIPEDKKPRQLSAVGE
jgi:glycerol-3-phosphate dehydrogenase